MSRMSAGLLMYRRVNGRLEVFLAHPGGPLWANRDEGAWTIPKGELEDGEDPLEAARREFEEETGFEVSGVLRSLGSNRQPGGKMVYAWAIEGDADPGALKSNTFMLRWPRNSSRLEEFPEVDRADWFTLEIARKKIMKGQLVFLDRLENTAL